MKKFQNTRIANLSPYTPGEQPKSGERFIKLNTNENPYPPSPELALLVVSELGDSGDVLRLYPDPECRELRACVAARFDIGMENVFISNGSDEALAFAFGAFFESGSPETGAEIAPKIEAKSEIGTESLVRPVKHILFPDISYSFYPVYAKLWNVPYKTAPLADNWTINIGDYTAPSGLGGAVFPNPNAPTGRALSVDAIEAAAAALLAQDAVLIVDEAYIAFSAVPSCVPLSKRYPNLLVIQTFSKGYSLAGGRVGFALGDAGLIDSLQRIRDSFNSYTVDRLAQVAALAALSDHAYFDETRKKVIATRARVSAALTKNGWDVIPSEANFILARHPRIAGGELCALLKSKNILVRHFNHERVSPYIRVSIGTDGDMDAFLAAVLDL